eukprot:11043022-Ditylum_brightwellii.AAC.1
MSPPPSWMIDSIVPFAKPMHIKFFVQQKEVLQVDLEQSHRWLRHANLRCKTEAADAQQPVVPNCWHHHKSAETPSICLDKGRTLMYNMKQRVEHTIATNHPGIVLLDETKKMALLINMTCPMDVNMVTAAAEKHMKYRDLEIDMKKQYKLRKIQTVPIVIGALGMLCQNFDTNLAKVAPRACAATIQKEVLLGMSHIL